MAGLNNIGLPVGSLIHSLLTETQFQDEAGTGWILADGRSVSGSAYHSVTGSTSIPDFRGTVIRGKDNGRGLDPDGNPAIGTYQADTLGSHTHNINQFNGIAGSTTYAIGVSAAGSGAIQTTSYGGPNGYTGSAETRSKATIANIFVRIN